jgi:hypothetical protein
VLGRRRMRFARPRFPKVVGSTTMSVRIEQVEVL